MNHYDALGNRVGQSDALGHTTTYIYDNLNRPAATASAEGVVTVRGYDELGRVVTTTDSLGHQTLSEYDTMGRQVAVTDAEGNVTRYVYDALGNQVAITDANDVRTSYLYDDLNRLAAVIENDTGGASTHDSNVLTQYVYDALGNRIVITNALGYTSAQTTYDVLGRPVVVEDALGHETRTQYNALGYRTVVTDANDAVIHYSYDGLNRLIGVHYVSDDVTVTYRYDAASNRTVMTDTLGTTLYVYDDLGRLVSVSDPLTGTVEYGYDLVGNRTQLIYPDGRVVAYTCDADNRLVQVEDWSGGLTGYEYDVAGRLITTTLPNGMVTTNQYDDANRLIDLAHIAADDTLLSSYSYELDDTGNRVRVVETLTETTRTITYTYDYLYRLTEADYSSGESFQYAYNATGSMMAMTTTVTNTVVTTKAYDAANRLITVTANGAVRTLEWSDDGELLRDGDDVYQWSAAGQLVSATVDGVISRYAYLGDGGRISMTTGSETTTYTLDLAAPLVQVLVAHESASQRISEYLYGMARIGEYDGEWRYHLADHLGSVRLLVDEGGEVTGTRAYRPYGSALSVVGSASSIYGFTGEQVDPTGLVYLRARMLDPTQGRFISWDQWQGTHKRPLTLNPYLYALANPVAYTDPSGQSPFCLLKREVDGTLTREMDDYGSRVCWNYLGNVETMHSIEILTEPHENSPLQWQAEFPADVTPPPEAGGLPYWDWLDLLVLDLGLRDLRRIVGDSTFEAYFKYPSYDIRPGTSSGGFVGVTFFGLGANTRLKGKTTVWHEHWHQADFKWRFLGLDVMGGAGGIFAGLLNRGSPHGWYDWSGPRPSDIPSGAAPGGRAYQYGAYDMTAANAVEVFAELGTLYLLHRLGIEVMPDKYVCEMNRVLWALKGNPLWQAEYCTDDGC